MLKTKLFFILFLAYCSTVWAQETNKKIYDFITTDISGETISLEKYKGKTLLIVNVASKCGLTPQYAELQALYDEYADKDFEILAFPANNFMNQEPGANSEIRTFCTTQYGITFPVFGKISVKGNDIDPLYNFLTKKEENGVLDAPVTWNFQKFLIDAEGNVVCSFAPKQKVNNKEVKRRIINCINGNCEDTKATKAKKEKKKK